MVVGAVVLLGDAVMKEREIDFSKVTGCKRTSGGGRPQPTMAYLRKDLPNDIEKYNYSFVLPNKLTRRVMDRFGDTVGIGYLEDTREVVIFDRGTPSFPSRKISISKGKTGNNSVGQISFGAMKEHGAAKKMYGDHKRVYFDVEEVKNGFIFVPNGQVFG